MPRFVDARPRGRASLRLRTALAACAVLLAPGCGSTLVEIGSPPRVDRLESGLELRKSTAEDVVRVLGIPSGTGQSQLPIDGEPRVMWNYHYERSTTTAISPNSMGLSFLFVYFRDGLYDGYLWWSSVLPRNELH